MRRPVFRPAVPSMLVLTMLLALSSAHTFIFVSASQERGPAVHDPIVIIGNGNFTSKNGVTSGSGLPDNPYIIENWVINASLATLGVRIIWFGNFAIHSPGILIANTTAYFVIRNVNVHSGLQVGEDVPRNGIVLFHVAHASIEGSTINQDYVGIATLFVEDSIITNNLFRDNLVGMNLELSSRITVNRNMIIDGGVGIELVNRSHDNVFSNNRIERQSEEGVIISDDKTTHNLFVNNIVRDTGTWGFEVNRGAFFNVFKNNLVMGNIYGGFIIRGVYGSELTGNHIVSDGVGIRLVLSPSYITRYITGFNNITDNYIVQNDIGILVCKSPGNVLQPNIFAANDETIVENISC